jgi:hypothetical protein
VRGWDRGGDRQRGGRLDRGSEVFRVDRDGPRLEKRATDADAGHADPKVTGDAEHLETGLTDESDWARWVMRELWRIGIGPQCPAIAMHDLDDARAANVRV